MKYAVAMENGMLMKLKLHLCFSNFMQYQLSDTTTTACIVCARERLTSGTIHGCLACRGASLCVGFEPAGAHDCILVSMYAPGGGGNGRPSAHAWDGHSRPG